MLQQLSTLQNRETFSISPENPTGEKGKGGMSIDGVAKDAARELGQGWKVSPYINIEPGQTATLANVQCQGAIKHIWITTSIPDYRDLILRVYWDGSETASIEVPFGDFFASATRTEFRPLSSLAVCVNPKNGFNCYWEMPFYKGFHMTLENISNKQTQVYYQIDCEKKELSEDTLYFHAQFRRVNPLPYGTEYTILDNIQGIGHYVGTYLFWGVHQNGWWGEGEIKFYLDGDKQFPTICGTGTEDYFCGAYNFDVNGSYHEFSTPYTGMYKVEPTDQTYLSQRRFHMYRWHICDPIYFKQEIKVTIQALGWRKDGRYLPLQDDISSVAYWYQSTVCTEFPSLPDRNGLEII